MGMAIVLGVVKARGNKKARKEKEERNWKEWFLNIPMMSTSNTSHNI